MAVCTALNVATRETNTQGERTGGRDLPAMQIKALAVETCARALVFDPKRLYQQRFDVPLTRATSPG